MLKWEATKAYSLFVEHSSFEDLNKGKTFTTFTQTPGQLDINKILLNVPLNLLLPAATDMKTVDNLACTGVSVSLAVKLS